MDVPIVKVWSAWTTVNEYGKHGNCLGIFNEKQAAEFAAKGQGWYGGNGDVSEETAIIVGEKAFILKQKEPIIFDSELHKLWDARKAALAKLTKEDMIVLGLKWE